MELNLLFSGRLREFTLKLDKEADHDVEQSTVFPQSVSHDLHGTTVPRPLAIPPKE